MKVLSTDGKSYISIHNSKDNENEYVSYALEIVSDIGHSCFKGKNYDLHLVNRLEFIEQFDSFILDRSVNPVLEGTYGSYLSFSGYSNVVEVAYCLGSSESGRRSVNSFSQHGMFEIPQENLTTIMSELKQLLNE